MFHRRLHFGLLERKRVICYLYLYLSLCLYLKLCSSKISNIESNIATYHNQPEVTSLMLVYITTHENELLLIHCHGTTTNKTKFPFYVLLQKGVDEWIYGRIYKNHQIRYSEKTITDNAQF